MSREVEQIKDRLDIVSVVGEYLELHKAGANYKANCPFHHEKTPSFFVSPGRNSFYCFGCGAKGDIFSFVEELEGLDFRGALEFLAKKAGVEITKIPQKTREENDRAVLAIEEASAYFIKELEKNKDAYNYLLKRGLTGETIKKFSLGFAPAGWRNLREYLANKGFTDEEMLRAGLIKKTDEDKGKEPYDVFRDRIIFPLSESSGRIVGFSGRSMDEETNPPKYLNSPDSKIFNKGEILYGLDKGKGVIREKDFSVLVEGQMDLLMSHQSGITNTVAASGTAVTKSHIERLKKISQRILISLDADGAGVRAALRTATIALDLGLEVKISKLTGKDPAEIILKNLEEYKECLRKALPFLEFVWDMIANETQDERARAKRVEKEIVPLLALIQSAVERSHTIKTISKKSGIPERALEEDVQRFKRSKGKALLSTGETVKSGPQKEVINQMERHAVGLLFAIEDGGEFPVDVNKALSFLTDVEKASMLDRYKPKREELVFEVENYYGTDSPDRARRDLEEVILNYRKDCLKKRLEALNASLSRIESTKDKGQEMQILKLIQETQQELNS